MQVPSVNHLLSSVQRDTIARVQATITERLSNQRAGHGVDHVWRVLANARQIQAEVGGDAFVIDLACLLHDVGDAKFCNGVERSAEFSRQILSEQGVSEPIIEQVAHIVDNISFRKSVTSDKLSLEGQIVQDADRLDALGAIGIVRTIEYGAAFDQPFFVPGQVADIAASRSGVGHFYQKLFRLRDRLNTAVARRMAVERERFMRDFLSQYFLEMGLSSSQRQALLEGGQFDQRQ